MTDRISAWFVPCVILVASLTGSLLWMQGASSSQIMLRVLSILLISCPCAIGIAAPLAQSYLLRAMTGCGAVVRNRNALSFLGRPTLLVCDKTGTLTLGRFTVLAGLETLSPASKTAPQRHDHALHSPYFQRINRSD